MTSLQCFLTYLQSDDEADDGAHLRDGQRILLKVDIPRRFATPLF